MVNQAHRWVQFLANTSWGLMCWVLQVDILSFRFGNVREYYSNKPDPGREGTYIPTASVQIRVAMLHIYGWTLCTWVYCANMVFGN